MPTTLKIIDGPPFKKFLFLSTIATDHGWLQEFTLSDREKIKITIHFIGRFRIPVSDGYDEDTFSFVGSRQVTGDNWNWHFYVGQYNCRNRQGSCECFVGEEFTQSLIVQSLCKA